MPSLGRIRRVGTTTVVELDGDADLAALPALSQVLGRATTGDAPAVVVDLDGLVVLDDAALGLIIGAAASARRRGGDLTLICTDERRRARLVEARLDRIVEFVEAVENPDRPGVADPAD